MVLKKRLPCGQRMEGGEGLEENKLMPQRQDSRREPIAPHSGTDLTVNFDLLLPVLADIPDEVVHLPHQLQVAEGQFIRRHPEHVPHGSKCPGKWHTFFQTTQDKQQIH